MWKPRKFDISPGLALLLALAFAPFCGRSVGAAEAPGATVAFNRDIQPILSANCFHCHGPDKAQRKAGLRLDTEEGAFAPLESGGRAIIRGDVSKSELIRRITSDDDDERMPPPDSGYRLSSAQKDLLVRWVKEGARWQKHWSFIRPERPPLPPVKNRAWPRVSWDVFVLARLEHDGLEPSPGADKEALIRRVTLDLT